MPKLSRDPLAYSLASIYLAAQHEPDTDSCSCANQNKVVRRPASGSAQSKLRFVQRGGGRIVFNHYANVLVSFDPRLRTAAQMFRDRHVAPIKSWCIEQPLALGVGKSGNADPDHLQCPATRLGAQAINTGPDQR